MRKKEYEIKNFDGIEDVIERCDTLRIGISCEPAPYIVPVSFGYDINEEKLTFYFHGAKEGLKHELLEQNAYVCVEGDICHRFIDTGKSGVTCLYESFIGYGHASKITDAEAVHALGLLLAHCGYNGYSYNPSILSVMNVYKIEIDEITGKHRQL